MQRKRLATAVVAVVAVLGLSIFAIGASQRSVSGGGQAAAGQGSRSAGGKMPAGMPGFGAEEQATAKAVKAKAAELKTLRPYIDGGGDVEAATNVSVYPDIGGKLADVKVALGDSVDKGQAIASVDPSKPGSSYAISAVASPISGTVTSVLAEQGETVSTSTAIVKVGVIDDLEIALYLPERDSAKAKKGMSAKVSFEAFPGESFAATVSRVSPVLDATSRTREVTLKLDSGDERVAAGMYANVRLYTVALASRIVIPAAAVTTRDGASFVYVVAAADGKKTAKKTAVTTGSSVDDEIEISKGVAAGDLIVYEGQDLLSDGAEVSVVGEGSE